ncbi:hypothetical protein GCM10027176_52600 [Actinoallomurus bryophytorum]|uniref:Uncharacterized protein n=1 Tax=Actinoallomurus bryophytorum TaxID=1490222 RepID=A0A543CHL8_9ACTN|nr:hypothetical protein FB559_2042 [Actinoallomurus bryophytorum]
MLALFFTLSSLRYKPGADVDTSYAAGRFGTPLIFAVIALACGIPALLRIRRPPDQYGRSWDGKEPATFSVVAGYFAAAVAIVRIALLVASR